MILEEALMTVVTTMDVKVTFCFSESSGEREERSREDVKIASQAVGGKQSSEDLHLTTYSVSWTSL